MKFAASIAVFVGGLACAALSVEGAEPAPKKADAKSATPVKPDIAFLEYLGTLEGDDENWTDIANTVLAESRRKRAANREAPAKSQAETK